MGFCARANQGRACDTTITSVPWSTFAKSQDTIVAGSHGYSISKRGPCIKKIQSHFTHHPSCTYAVVVMSNYSLIMGVLQMPFTASETTFASEMASKAVLG